MQTERQEQKRAALQIVMVRMANGAQAKEPALLFTARQVEEVLPEVRVQPLPFAPNWLLGLCAWRQQSLPVIDAVKLYELDCALERVLHVVVRTVVPERGDGRPRQMLRCLLRVPGHIAASNLPAQCVPASAEESGFAPALVKGVFAYENGLLIVPDLLPALCPAADSIFQMPVS